MKKLLFVMLTIIISSPFASAKIIGDINGDSKIGLEEAIYAIQIISSHTQPVYPTPSADAGPDQTITWQQTVTLDGSASLDPTNKALTYLWNLSKQPAGSTATLNNLESITPTFVPDLNGEYITTLTLINADNKSNADTVKANVDCSFIENVKGDYTGSFTGAEFHGNWTASIADNGELTFSVTDISGGVEYFVQSLDGTGTLNNDGTISNTETNLMISVSGIKYDINIPLTGRVNCDGSFNATSGDSRINISGIINPDGSVTGNWAFDITVIGFNENDSGTFTGSIISAD